jgi:hypothetical protein
MPELLAPCWEGSTFRWKLCFRELLYMASAISLLLLCSIFVPQEPENKGHLTEPHTGGRYWYDGVLPGALKGSVVTLLSPPQCLTALGMIPHILALVDQSPVCHPKMLLPPPWRGHQGLDFGEVSIGYFHSLFLDCRDPCSIDGHFFFQQVVRKVFSPILQRKKTLC